MYDILPYIYIFSAFYLYSGQLQLTQDKLHREQERAHHLEGIP